MTEFNHYSVMLGEATDALEIHSGGIYFDCTLGGGGHTAAILGKMGGDGMVVAVDRDESAVENAKRRFGDRSDLTVVHDNFVNVRNIAQRLGISAIDGAVIDLGVSSYQLDTAERGFSYMADAPLDMRMDTSESLTARDVVNNYSEREISRILFEYGEERYANRIASRICALRNENPIETTGELVDIIKGCVPAAKGEGHPAKRSFQALRIEVNGELSVIEPTLRDLVGMLSPGGRLAVISFHSLEDRIVKRVFASLAKGCDCPKDFPVCVCGKKPVLSLITRKPLLPGREELEENKRSHSAKLRVVEKLPVD